MMTKSLTLMNAIVFKRGQYIVGDNDNIFKQVGKWIMLRTKKSFLANDDKFYLQIIQPLTWGSG